MARREIQWDKIIGRILAISLALMIICVASNITMRISDTYQYNLNESQILNTAPVVVDEATLINTFGNYMSHKTNDFSIKEAVDYKPQDVFTTADKQAMHNLRFAMDIVCLIGILALIVSVVCFFFLIRWRKKAIHMRAVKQSVVVLILILLINTAFKMVPALRTYTWGRLFSGNFKSDDFLILILQNNFAMQVSVLDIIISAIVCALIVYFTWEVAGRKKMFRRR